MVTVECRLQNRRRRRVLAVQPFGTVLRARHISRNTSVPLPRALLCLEALKFEFLPVPDFALLSLLRSRSRRAARAMDTSFSIPEEDSKADV